MPEPPMGGRWPSSGLPSANQHYFTISERQASAQNQWAVRGPFLCTHVATAGNLVIPGQGGIQQVVDERVWVPAAAGVSTASVMTNVTTGEKFRVIFVKPIGAETECYTVRQTPT